MTDNNLNQFIPLLKDGLSYLKQLHKLLEDEQKAIIDNDLEQLELVIGQKRTSLGEFFKCKDEWSRIISSRGHSVEQFINSLPPSAADIVKTSWQQLEDENRVLQELNTRNSNLVNTKSRQVVELLSILKGHQTNQQLYTGIGDRNNYQAQSRLGKA